MKLLSLFLILLLFLPRSVWAQQPVSGTDTVRRVERIVYPDPTPQPPMTAADSAKERARQANVRWLREHSKNNPAHPTSLTPVAPTPVKATAPQPTEPDPKVLAKDAKRREKAAEKAAEADKKREKTLYKRAKKTANTD